MIFSIKRKLSYDLSREDFLNLVGASEDEIIKDNRMIIMVEKTEQAYLVDGSGNAP